MSEQEANQALLEDQQFAEELKERFSKPTMPDPMLQSLVALGTTKHSDQGSFSFSFPIVIMTHGMLISGSTVSYDAWHLAHARELDLGIKKSIQKLTNAPLTELKNLEELEQRLKDAVKKNTPPRFIHLKDVRFLKPDLPTEFGSKILRIRLESIDGWCLAQ